MSGYYGRPFSPFSAPRGGGFFDRLPPVTGWLMKANIAAYLVTWIGCGVLRSPIFNYLYSILALSLAGVKQGMVWQPLTYMFLHGGFIHILFNMMTLYFLGPETERTMGSRHFLAMYLLSGIIGGLGWLWLSGSAAASCVGASGAIFGILGAFATLYPKRELTIFVFIFPVTAAAWKIVAGISLLQFLLVTGGANDNIAYAAHLAGAFAGFLYIDQLFENRHFRRLLSRIGGGFKWPFGGGGARRSPFSRDPDRDPPPSREEVDRILEKIARDGIESLTRAERQTLHRASRTM
ncbi:MAG: rhomboid family intramembrane serine protease [Kiritimatiellae bacterium]|nr:rhomboid family intramembrane serine protease [Kiritimatiellia bacterium]MBR4251240.1 rhomboid family intramembrane serine protease [Kiritimatiellia bacterium]